MNQHARGVIIGMGGFMAGLLVGQSTTLATIPKASLVVMTSLVVSMILLHTTRSHE